MSSVAGSRRNPRDRSGSGRCRGINVVCGGDVDAYGVVVVVMMVVVVDDYYFGDIDAFAVDY